MPYRAWCEHCVAARRRNSPHLRSSDSSQRSKPLLVADYCFVRDNHDKELATILVARLYPSKALLATVCPHKGVDEVVISRMASFIKDSGYSSIDYRSDQEPSIRAMFEEAFKVAGREGLHQMVPEASAVGESQSNGKAESSVQKVEDLLRTYKSALETNINERIPADHPVFAWMVDHTASIYNRLVCTDDGTTPYQCFRNQR